MFISSSPRALKVDSIRAPSSPRLWDHSDHRPFHGGGGLRGRSSIYLLIGFRNRLAVFDS
jgi:hypothetical protein